MSDPQQLDDVTSKKWKPALLFSWFVFHVGCLGFTFTIIARLFAEAITITEGSGILSALLVVFLLMGIVGVISILVVATCRRLNNQERNGN